MNFQPKTKQDFLTPEQVAAFLGMLQDKTDFLQIFYAPKLSIPGARVVYEKSFDYDEVENQIETGSLEEFIMTKVVDLIVEDIRKVTTIREPESILVIGHCPEVVSDRDIMRRKIIIFMSLAWQIFNAAGVSANACTDPGHRAETVKG